MQTRDVTLETSWPVIYHDLIAEGLKVTRRPVALRTQTKNARRESEQIKFSPSFQFLRAKMRIAYSGERVLQTPSKTVLEVMCNATETSFAEADYRLPIPDAWGALLSDKLGSLPKIAFQRPWLVYRPLVARPEWRGSVARNADAADYAALFAEIREEFFVISVADLVEGQEWMVGPDAKPDLSFHSGELVFEALAALFARADLVFTSSGFAAVLGPAVGTPTISIVGGYEDYRCHDSGAKFSPYLAIGPKAGCSCWTSACHSACDKSIDVITAKDKLRNFVSLL
jgi:ADP-heptose:LPS heptosyltransferase